MNQQPTREELEVIASALAGEPQPAHLLITVLMTHLNDHDLANVIRGVVGSFQRMPAWEDSTKTLLARLERERPAFFDANRPGE
jgi:hypothetical protein